MRFLCDMSGFRNKFTTVIRVVSLDDATCRPAGMFPSTVSETKEAEVSESSLHGSFTKSGERKNVLELQSVVFREVGRDLSKQSPLLLESESSPDVQDQRSEEDDKAGRRMEDRRNDKEEDCSQRCMQRGKDVSSSPQFCSRHQRWVKSIMRGCPDNCSEELLRQTNASSSPVLFQSSSSTSTSQDLTPSDLVPSPADQPPSQTSTTSQPSETTNADKRSPKTSDPSQRAALLQPTSTKTSPRPALLSPVVRLVDIASSWGSHQQISSNYGTVFITKQASIVPLASSLCCASGNKDSEFVSPKTGPNVQTTSVHQDVSACTSRQLPVPLTSFRLSYKFRRACATSSPSQALTNKSAAELSVKDRASFPTSCPLLSSDLHVPKQNASTSPPQTLNMSSAHTESSVGSPQQIVHQNSDKPHPGSHNTSAFQNKSIACRVRLTRLSAQECRRATEGRASAGREESVKQSSCGDEQTRETQENVYCSFDVNTLYSSGSSSSDWEDFGGPDPDYKPCIKRKRLLLEYESARILNHT